MHVDVLLNVTYNCIYTEKYFKSVVFPLFQTKLGEGDHFKCTNVITITLDF